MAIGDTVQAGLMRIDTSAIERAGQAQAKANQAFGNALGQAATAYFEGKEKKEQKNALKEYLMRNGANEEDANAMTKSPQALEMFNQKLARDQQMDIAKMGQKNASDILAQKAAFEENRIKEKNEEKQSNINVAKFNLTRPDLPITEETPAAFLPDLDPDPFVGPPTTYQGQAPAVAQLPERFQPQGAQVVDAFQSGQLSPLEGNRIMGSIQAQAMAEQKAGPTPQEILNYKKTAGEMVRDETEFQQKQDAIGFKPEINYLDLGDPSGGGVRFGISGKYANETEVAKIKSDVLPSYSNMNAITDQLIKMGEDIEGDFFVSPSDKVLAESLKSSLQGLIREDILGPGTVNDSERAILEQVIENPVEYFNVKRNRRDKINSLKGLRKKAFNKLRTRFKGLGLDVSEFGQGGNASGPNKSPNMQNKTNSGLGYEFVPLDEL